MSWRIATLRNNRVYARCNATGAFIVENGRVEIRYRPDDGRAYHASERNLIAHQNEPILPDDTCASLAPSISKKPKKGAVSVVDKPAIKRNRFERASRNRVHGWCVHEESRARWDGRGD
jgi:hypothetical protein